jgi:hypothetical protein
MKKRIPEANTTTTMNDWMTAVVAPAVEPVAAPVLFAAVVDAGCCIAVAVVPYLCQAEASAAVPP